MLYVTSYRELDRNELFDKTAQENLPFFVCVTSFPEINYDFQLTSAVFPMITRLNAGIRFEPTTLDAVAKNRNNAMKTFSLTSRVHGYDRSMKMHFTKDKQ